jgi:hypothetical protein
MADSKDLVLKNLDTLDKIDRVVNNELRNILNLGSSFDRNDFGGLTRRVIPPVIEQYSNISGQLALTHYNEMREAAFAASSGIRLSNSASRRREAAIVSSNIKVRKNNYFATVPFVDVTLKSEKSIGYIMQTFASKGFDAARTAAIQSVSREIAMVNRDTILFNTTLDSSVQRVQRVADPNACAFCLVLSLNEPRGYAVNFHAGCKCTIEPVFEGQQSVRPAYYEDLEAKYEVGKAAADEAGQSGAKAVFAAIRATTGAK